MRSLKTYFRCCAQNKFTLAGYLLLFIWIVTTYLFAKGKLEIFLDVPNYVIMVITFICSFPLLAFTGFGLETYEAYCRCMKILSNHPDQLKNITCKYGSYCGKSGARLAEKDIRAYSSRVSASGVAQNSKNATYGAR